MSFKAQRITSLSILIRVIVSQLTANYSIPKRVECIGKLQCAGITLNMHADKAKDSFDLLETVEWYGGRLIGFMALGSSIRGYKHLEDLDKFIPEWLMTPGWNLFWTDDCTDYIVTEAMDSFKLEGIEKKLAARYNLPIVGIREALAKMDREQGLEEDELVAEWHEYISRLHDEEREKS